LGAVLVVCFHGKEQLNGVFGIELGKILFQAGSVGVPIFFAISGFIIVYTTKKLSQNTFSSIKTFFLKRVFRILPMYWLFTILWMIVFLSIPNYLKGNNGIRLLKSLFFIPDSSRPVLFLGWTLNYEIFFYILFAISLFFNKLRYYALGFFFIIILFLRQFHFEYDYLKMVTNPVMNYFAFGVFLALVIDKIKLSKLQLQFFTSISIILFLGYYFQILHPPNTYIKLLIEFSFISVFILWDFQPKTTELPPKLIFLGDMSFSIYLFHPFILLGFRQIFPSLLQFPDYVRILIFIIEILLILSISYLIYFYIERKIIEKLNSYF